MLQQPSVVEEGYKVGFNRNVLSEQAASGVFCLVLKENERKEKLEEKNGRKRNEFERGF